MVLDRTARLALAVVLQASLILGIALYKQVQTAGGTEVLIRITPVDPRDPLRGDYVTFRLSISRLDESLFSYSPIRPGDIVWVPLERKGRFWEAAGGVSKEPPGEDGVAIKGQVEGGRLGSWRGAGGLDGHNLTGTIELVYGIEEYFIPEGTGRDYDLRGQDREPYATVALDGKGHPVLKTITP